MLDERDDGRERVRDASPRSPTAASESAGRSGADATAALDAAAGVYDGNGPRPTSSAGRSLHRSEPASRIGAPPANLDLHTGVLHEVLDLDTGESRVSISCRRRVPERQPCACRIRRRSMPSGARLVRATDAEPYDEGRTSDRTWMRVAGSSVGIATATSVEPPSSAAPAVLDLFVAYEADPDRLPDARLHSRAQTTRSQSVSTDCSPNTRGVGAALGGRRHRHRRRRAAPGRDRGSRSFNSWLRSATATKLRSALVASVVPAIGSRVLGRGHVRPAVPRRGASRVGAGDARVPDSTAGGRTRPSRPLELAPGTGFRGSRRAAVATSRPVGTRPHRTGHSDPDRTTRRPHRCRRRVGRVLLRGVDRRRRVRQRAGLTLLVETAATGRRDPYRGRRRAHLRRDRSGRVPRAGRRQCVHERHRPLEPAAGGRAVARADRGTMSTTTNAHVARARRRWSTGTTRDTGIYEQFAGFNRLEPLIIEDVAPRRPIAADLLLGAERVHRSQIIKQADVLMLHHLVPEEVVPGIVGTEPPVLRTSYRSRQLAVAGNPRAPVRAGSRLPPRPRRPADRVSHRSRRPDRNDGAGACMSRPWVACGRRSCSGSRAFGREPDGSRSTLTFRRVGPRSKCAFDSVGAAS